MIEFPQSDVCIPLYVGGNPVRDELESNLCIQKLAGRLRANVIVFHERQCSEPIVSLFAFNASLKLLIVFCEKIRTGLLSTIISPISTFTYLKFVWLLAQ